MAEIGFKDNSFADVFILYERPRIWGLDLFRRSNRTSTAEGRH